MKMEIEFDEQGLIARVAQASIAVLKRMGAYVRTVARRKVHLSDKPSLPNSPPHSRRGALKRSILFGVEKRERTVLIGPGFRFIGTSLAAHEFGGKYKKEHYPKRPLMWPSLKESTPHLAQFWRDAVK